MLAGAGSTVPPPQPHQWMPFREFASVAKTRAGANTEIAATARFKRAMAVSRGMGASPISFLNHGRGARATLLPSVQRQRGHFSAHPADVPARVIRPWPTNQL